MTGKLLDQYLLSAYSEPGTFIGSGDTAGEKRLQNFHPHGAYILAEGDR